MTRTATGAIARRWQSFLSERVIPIAFSLSVLGIASVGFLAQYFVERTVESEAWVLHTAVVLAKIEGLHQTIVEAESAGRAFLVTGDPIFRESYDETLNSIDGQLFDLKRRTIDNRMQQDLAADLEPHINRRFAWLGGQLGVRAAQGFNALQQARIGAGVEEMRKIAAILERMKETEKRLLAQRTDVRRRQNKLLEMGLGTLITAALVIISVIFWYMNRLWKLRQQAEQRAVHLAQHDALTALPNRRLLADRIAMGIAHAKRSKRMLALLCLDLDGFKLINDEQGHAVGDEVLKIVAGRLKASLRAEDTVARLGGDEFVVMLPLIDDGTYGNLVADKIIRQISAPYAVNGTTVRIGTSIGIAIYPLNGSTEDELMKHADLALYEAKRTGRGRYVAATAQQGLVYGNA